MSGYGDTATYCDHCGEHLFDSGSEDSHFDHGPCARPVRPHQQPHARWERARILHGLRREFLSEYKGHLDCTCGSCCEGMGCDFEDLIPALFGEPWNPNPRPPRIGPIGPVDMSTIPLLENQPSAMANLLTSLGKEKPITPTTNWMTDETQA